MRKALYILVFALLAFSCKMTHQFSDAASELFRGEAVAKVGNHKLYRNQLQSYIPTGVSPEDSASLAASYIKAWAEDLLLLDMAEEQLSKEDKDVSQDLEEYRREMAGVYTTSVNEATLDEAPMAYKSLEDIIDVIRDSVDVIEVLKPIYNFKAN